MEHYNVETNEYHLDLSGGTDEYIMNGGSESKCAHFIYTEWFLLYLHTSGDLYYVSVDFMFHS